MSEAINDGGPAYPVADPFAFRPGHEDVAKRLAHGMSLRDYFAGLALTAIIRDKEEQSYWVQDYSPEECAQFTAERAYSFADAMIRARATGKGE